MVTTRTAPQPRLPGAGRSPDSRAAEVIRGLLALVSILVIVVGTPVALYAGFGTPWPDTMPSTDWIYADVTPRDALAVLVGIVWLGWLHFVVCLVVEFVAERRQRGLSPHVPGGSVGTQPLARRLVGAVVLLSSGLSIAVPAASAVTTDRQVSTSSLDSTATDAGRSASVHDERRVQHRIPHSGVAFTDAQAGVTHKYVEVQPPAGRHYDTLWGIAERYLGDGLRYKEIAALNRGVVQPDGTALKDPDLIYPGYILKLPADAEGPGLRIPEENQRGAEVGTPRPEGRAGHQHAEPTEETGPSVEPSHDTAEPGGGSDTTSVALATGFTAGGVLLAAGLLFSLRRRRGWNGSPPPRGGLPLDPEEDLRNSADEPSATFVDRALRSLRRAVPAGASLPGPTSSLLGADALAVTFPVGQAPDLSSPWSAAGERTWVLRRDQVTTPSARLGDVSPWPGLVAIGARDDSVEVLFDVESAGGLVSISGDLDVAREIAVAIGLGLATSPWSDAPRIDFVGFADDLADLAPDRIRHYDDLTAVFDIVDAKRRRQSAACAAEGCASVSAARLVAPDARLWAPDFIVLSGVPSAADITRLAALAADPRAAVGVVVVGDVRDAKVRMIASHAGRLVCGPLGVDVQAHRVAAGTYRDALAIFDAEVSRRQVALEVDGARCTDPALLENTAVAPVEIRTLGPVRVDAPGAVDEARRDLLTELVVYLALHPDGVHPNVLSAALWPRGVSEDVRDSTLAQVATWLGVDTTGAPRLTNDDSGSWRLGPEGVRLDWDVFRAVANRSASSAEPRPQLHAALSLVRGPAWSNLPAQRYGWLAHETVEADTRLAVVAVARRQAELAAAAGDPVGARTALLTGLELAPACEEIWRDALVLAERFADSDDVHAVATDMYAAISRFGSPRGAEAETEALIDELLPDFRRGSAA